MFKNNAEAFFCQFLPLARGKIQYFGQRSKSGFGGGFAETVPGTNILAYITAKKPVVKPVFHFPGQQHIFQLNGKITDAFTAIYHLAGQDGAGRAAIDAAGAAAAEIFGKGIVVFQVQVNNQGSDKKERAGLFGNEVAVFPNPASPGLLCPAAFQHRRRINKTAAVYFAHCFLQALQHFVEFGSYNFVVVISVSILGYFRAIGLLGLFRIIVQQQRHHRFCAGHQQRGVYPQVKIVFHVLHLPVHALVQPGFQAARIVIQFTCTGNAAVAETQFLAERFNEICIKNTVFQLIICLVLSCIIVSSTSLLYMYTRTTAILTLLLTLSSLLHAEREKPAYKFGNVKPEDFAPTAYAVDSSADAVFLYDIGNSGYEGNTKGFLDVVYQRHARIRLLHKNAFDGLATVSILLWGKDNNADKLVNLDAATYNLEGGAVVTTKVEKSAIFRDKNAEYTVAKFTFPNIKEGSVIEYSYTVTSSRYSNLQDWYYQGEYPRLYSQYQVTIPSLLDFVFVKQGYHPYVLDSVSSFTQSYNLLIPGETIAETPSSLEWRGSTVNSIWAMKDVPALKDESFTTSLDNHRSKISFQLSVIRTNPDAPRNIMRNWYQMEEELMKDEDFGKDLLVHNGWMSDDLKTITAGCKTGGEKARNIYAWVRDHFTCTGEGGLYLSQSIKKTFQTKKGSVEDINLLLTSLLYNQGIDAHPVLLSTRSHGKAMETYPILDKFNYVICRASEGDSSWLLDASKTYLGFNHLDDECYNGGGRLIAEQPVLIPLSADSLRERKTTTVFLVNDSAHYMKGTVTCTPGDIESITLRNRLGKTKPESFFTDIQKGFTWDVALSNTGIDSLNQPDYPVSYNYDMRFTFEEGLVYFNPIIGDMFYRENPFKASTRTYPVEMPYCTEKIYVLNMDIPEGYEVEELPKSARVNLNDNEGKFEYIIQAAADKIQMRCVVKLNKANFMPDDYDTLRDFFAFVVKKEQEQIVFKKKKA